MNGPILVLGVGNLLAGDDGVGVHAVQALAELSAADGGPGPDVRVVDGGTMGLELLPACAEARAVILVDAVELRLPPGSVRTLQGAALGGVMAHAMSAHQVGVADLVALGRLTGMLPEHVVLVGVQPESLETTMELSPIVRAAMPEVLAAIRSAVAAVPDAPALVGR